MTDPDVRNVPVRLFDLACEAVSVLDRMRRFHYPVDIIRDMVLVLKLLARVRRRMREEREGIRVA